jgi:hypothetical protein
MIDKEQLKLDYLIATNKMSLSEVIKKAVEENEKNKLKECVDIISTYCEGQETCLHCMFFDEYGNTFCKLKNAPSPASWNDRIER